MCKRNWVRELTLILLKGLWLTFKQKFACINRITKKSCRKLEERQTEGQLSQIRNDSEVIYYIIFLMNIFSPNLNSQEFIMILSRYN